MKQAYDHPWRGNVPYLARRDKPAKPVAESSWHPWLPSEDKTLREMAGKYGAVDIAAKLPGRTEWSVRKRARRLKVSLIRHGDYNPTAKHSEEIVERCRQWYDDGLKPRIIAKRTGIPLKTVEKIVYYDGRVGELNRNLDMPSMRPDRDAALAVRSLIKAKA